MKFLAVRQSEEAIEKRAQLLKVLDQTKFTEDRSSGQRVHKKYGAERGRFVSFGLTQSRKGQASENATAAACSASAYRGGVFNSMD
jgi:ketol-acid reductoisomerase